MINKVNNNPVADLLKEVTAKQADSSGVSKNNTADASLQVSHEAVIEQAQQATAEDAGAVERARQLILSGQLDSPENIRKAAENIVKFGV